MTEWFSAFAGMTEIKENRLPRGCARGGVGKCARLDGEGATFPSAELPDCQPVSNALDARLTGDCRHYGGQTKQRREYDEIE